MSRTRRRGYRIREALRVRSLVFLLTWTRKKYGIAHARINQTEHGNTLPARRHRGLKKLPTQYVIYCAEPFSKWDLELEKRQADQSLSEYDPDKDNHYSYYSCMLPVVKFTSQCLFVMISTNDIKNLVLVKAWNCRGKTSRT